MSWGVNNVKNAKRENEEEIVGKRIETIENLCESIQVFSSMVFNLEKACKEIESAKEMDRLRGKMRQYRDSCKKLDENIKTALLKFGESRGLDSLKKRQIQKLSAQFAEISTRFANSYEFTLRAEREKVEMKHVFKNKKNLFGDDEPDDDTQGSGDFYDGNVPVAQQMQQVQKKVHMTSVQQATIDVEHQIAKETYESAKQLHSDLSELQEYFKDLSVLVKEQEETLDIVASNIEATNQNVEIGVDNIKSARGKTSLGSIQNIFNYGPLGAITMFLK